MRGKSHLCLGHYLTQHYMDSLPQRYRKAFLVGCIEPDRNPMTYFKGSLRSQWMRGHNYNNASHFMQRISRRLENKEKSEHRLDHNQRKHTAADRESKPCIGVNISGSADIISVIFLNGFHDGGQGMGLRSLVHPLFHVGKEMVLQIHFIGPMFVEIGGEDIIVCKGESIRGVVDQLAHGVVIPETVLFFLFQPVGNPGHEAAGIVVVVSPQPLGAERPFKIGHGVPIGLNAAHQERFLITLRQAVHVMLSEIMTETQMAFTTHKQFSLGFFL